MFEGFEEQKDASAKKRWFASWGTSLGVCVILAMVVMMTRSRFVRASRPEPIDVTFHAPPPEPESAKPPPPPPPPPQPKLASVARKAGKRTLTAPEELPQERPEEAAPTGEAPPPPDPDEFGDGPPAPPAPPP